ncbi:MAG: c-type cytochrome [Pseudomonadota bacterium]
MSGDVVDGRSYARDVCADCHVVEDSQPRVYAHQARPFERIAKDPKTTELSLRVFLQTPHLSMPDFILTERQTDDVIAYILSLKERMVE